jgi:hypothetical protein
VYEQRKVGRFPEVCDAAGFFDGGARKLGLHELHIGAIVSSLLGGVFRRDGSRGRPILGVVHGRLLARLD